MCESRLRDSERGDQVRAQHPLSLSMLAVLLYNEVTIIGYDSMTTVIPCAVSPGPPPHVRANHDYRCLWNVPIMRNSELSLMVANHITLMLQDDVRMKASCPWIL